MLMPNRTSWKQPIFGYRNLFEVSRGRVFAEAVGSILYEAELYLWYRYKITLLSALMFPIFEAIAFFDRHLGGQVGDELIIEAQKR